MQPAACRTVSNDIFHIKVTKQLNKAMVDDWNYQKEFKHRLAQDEKRTRYEDDLENNRINAQVEADIKQKEIMAQRKLGFEQKAELEAKENDKFQAEMAANVEKRKNTVMFGRTTTRIGIHKSKSVPMT